MNLDDIIGGTVLFEYNNTTHLITGAYFHRTKLQLNINQPSEHLELNTPIIVTFNDGLESYYDDKYSSEQIESNSDGLSHLIQFNETIPANTELKLSVVVYSEHDYQGQNIFASGDNIPSAEDSVFIEWVDEDTTDDIEEG